MIDGLKERHYDIIVTHEDPKDDELYTFPYRDERLSLLVPQRSSFSQTSSARA